MKAAFIPLPPPIYATSYLYLCSTESPRFCRWSPPKLTLDVRRGSNRSHLTPKPRYPRPVTCTTTDSDLNAYSLPPVIPSTFRVAHLLERWGNRTVLFVGDSLTRQLVDAIVVGAFREGIPSSTLPCPSHLPVFPRPGGPSFATVNFTGGLRLMKSCHEGPESLSPINRLMNAAEIRRWYTQYRDLRVELEGADVAYINVGLHVLVSDLVSVSGVLVCPWCYLVSEIFEKPYLIFFTRYQCW